MELLLIAQQPDAVAVAAQLDRIALFLKIIAITSAGVGLFAVISLVASLFALRSANRVLATMEKHMDRLAPRVEPLIEKVTRLADDSRDITDSVRRRVNDVMDTISDLNRRLRSAGEATEVRFREFAAVLDVVREEAEEVLLDTAATARGIHTAAAALRTPSPRPRAATEPEDEDVEDEDEEEVAT
jgi:methyl-accepting chemotaxis protein